jgi:hypothetical protein
VFIQSNGGVHALRKPAAEKRVLKSDRAFLTTQFSNRRSFVVLAVPGRPPAEPFVYGVIGYLSTLPRLTH